MLPQDLMRRLKQARKRKSDGSMKNLGHNFAVFLCRPGCVRNIKIVEVEGWKGEGPGQCVHHLPESLLSREFFVDDNVSSPILYTCEKLITVHKEHIHLLLVTIYCRWKMDFSENIFCCAIKIVKIRSTHSMPLLQFSAFVNTKKSQKNMQKWRHPRKDAFAKLKEKAMGPLKAHYTIIRTVNVLFLKSTCAVAQRGLRWRRAALSIAV